MEGLDPYISTIQVLNHVLCKKFCLYKAPHQAFMVQNGPEPKPHYSWSYSVSPDIS